MYVIKCNKYMFMVLSLYILFSIKNYIHPMKKNQEGQNQKKNILLQPIQMKHMIVLLPSQTAKSSKLIKLNSILFT